MAGDVCELAGPSQVKEAQLEPSALDSAVSPQGQTCWKTVAGQARDLPSRNCTGTMPPELERDNNRETLLSSEVWGHEKGACGYLPGRYVRKKLRKPGTSSSSRGKHSVRGGCVPRSIA